MKLTKPLFTLGAVLAAFAPLVTLAQDGTLGRLTALPFVSQGAGIGELIYGLFLLSISVAGIFAVVKLVIAGLKYMTSDVASTKQSAIGDIKGAVLGLVLLLAAIVILNAINPDIANTDIALRELPAVDLPEPNDEPSIEKAVKDCKEKGGTFYIPPTDNASYRCGEIDVENDVEYKSMTFAEGADYILDDKEREPIKAGNSDNFDKTDESRLQEEIDKCRKFGGTEVTVLEYTDRETQATFCWE